MNINGHRAELELSDGEQCAIDFNESGARINAGRERPVDGNTNREVEFSETAQSRELGRTFRRVEVENGPREYEMNTTTNSAFPGGNYGNLHQNFAIQQREEPRRNTSVQDLIDLRPVEELRATIKKPEPKIEVCMGLTETDAKQFFKIAGFPQREWENLMVKIGQGDLRHISRVPLTDRDLEGSVITPSDESGYRVLEIDENQPIYLEPEDEQWREAEEIAEVGKRNEQLIEQLRKNLQGRTWEQKKNWAGLKFSELNEEEKSGWYGKFLENIITFAPAGTSTPIAEQKESEASSYEVVEDYRGPPNPKVISIDTNELARRKNVTVRKPKPNYCTVFDRREENQENREQHVGETRENTVKPVVGKQKEAAEPTRKPENGPGRGSEKENIGRKAEPTRKPENGPGRGSEKEKKELQTEPSRKPENGPVRGSEASRMEKLEKPKRAQEDLLDLVYGANQKPVLLIPQKPQSSEKSEKNETFGDFEPIFSFATENKEAVKKRKQITRL